MIATKSKLFGHSSPYTKNTRKSSCSQSHHDSLWHFPKPLITRNVTKSKTSLNSRRKLYTCNAVIKVSL